MEEISAATAECQSWKQPFIPGGWEVCGVPLLGEALLGVERIVVGLGGKVVSMVVFSLAGGSLMGCVERYSSAFLGGKRRVEMPMLSVAQIMDWMWKVGQQLAVIPMSYWS